MQGRGNKETLLGCVWQHKPVILVLWGAEAGGLQAYAQAGQLRYLLRPDK